MIGDRRTAAVVAADGTIDWWCPAALDGEPALWRLLDPGGAAVSVRPAGRPMPGVQEYVAGTNVLRTVLAAGEGAIEVVDLLPLVRGRADGRIVRIVCGLRGLVDVEVVVEPAGPWRPARDVAGWSEGIVFDCVAMHAGCDLTTGRGRFTVAAGERRVVTIEATQHRPDPVSLDRALDLLERTRTAWRSHLSALVYEGAYRDDVERAVLLLGALTAPTGAVAGAATASLPWRIGGERNLDERPASLPATAAVARVLSDIGLGDEAGRCAEWLSLVLGQASPPWPVAYAVDGGAPSEEHEVPARGWRASQPVRVGARGDDRLRLDVLADLVDALIGGGAIPAWEALRAGAAWLADAWGRPDAGTWGLRGTSRLLVASKLAAWYALDRTARAAMNRDPLDLDAQEWRLAAREVVAWIERHGRAASGGLRMDTAEAPTVDAALVQVAWRNPWAPDTEIATRTVDRVIERLADGAFVRRYSDTVDDGFPPGEGASMAASFAVVEALARLERWDEAHERMEVLLAFFRPLGIVSEAADPLIPDALGNLPSAAALVALLRAAIALSRGPQ